MFSGLEERSRSDFTGNCRARLVRLLVIDERVICSRSCVTVAGTVSCADLLSFDLAGIEKAPFIIFGLYARSVLSHVLSVWAIIALQLFSFFITKISISARFECDVNPI